MRITTLCILTLLSITVVAQNPDSLWEQFNTEKLPDTTRLECLHLLSRHFRHNDPDTSLFFARLEQDYARRIDDSIWIAHGLNMEGMALTVKSDYPGALDRFIRCLEIRTALKDTGGVAAMYNNIGNIYFHQGAFPMALENFIRSLEYEATQGDEAGLAISYLNIGSVYALQEDFTNALSYFKQALEIYQKDSNKSGMGNSYANLGNIYKSLDSLDLSHDSYLKSIDFFKATGDDLGLAIIYSNLADVFARRDDPEQMFQHYALSEEIRLRLGDQMGMARLLVSRGLSHYNLQRYTMARDECARALSIAEAVGAMPEVRDACDCLYQVNKALGKNEQALIYYERMNALNVTMATEETRKQLQLMEFKKQVTADSLTRADEKQAIAEQHARAMKKESLRRNAFMIFGMLLALVAIYLLHGWRKTQKSKRTIEAEKSRTDQLLLNILPASVTKELLTSGKVEAREFENVTVLFTDLIGFTATAKDISPHDLVDELNQIIRRFDEIVTKHEIQKIKSIGDAYMAAGGLPIYSAATLKNTVLAALEMQDFIELHCSEREAANLPGFHMRVGIHHGPVIAGIVGFHNFHFDIWGDTVNLASRLENSGARGRVNISSEVYHRIKDDPDFRFEARGPIDVKGKRTVEMWFVANARMME